MTLFSFNPIKLANKPQTNTTLSFISHHFMLTLHLVFKVYMEKIVYRFTLLLFCMLLSIQHLHAAGEKSDSDSTFMQFLQQLLHSREYLHRDIYQGGTYPYYLRHFIGSQWGVALKVNLPGRFVGKNS